MLSSSPLGVLEGFGLFTPRLFAGPVSFCGAVSAVTEEAGFAPMKPRERSGGFWVDFMACGLSSQFALGW
tara:strand:+ start:253 stop:462 length:210 start_codon:yes stop_codon:yes gene_type:complete